MQIVEGIAKVLAFRTLPTTVLVVAIYTVIFGAVLYGDRVAKVPKNQKGLDLAVGACELARAHGQDISLTVVGIPAESAGLELASAGSWLIALGAVSPNEMEALYRRHDILLFPTRYEAFGLVALEAMAAGLPVIGSSVVRSLIEGAGEVVVGEDAGAYAEALRALADPERRRRLASVALERARAFSWETSAASYLEVLNVVARDRGHQRGHRAKQPLSSRSAAE